MASARGALISTQPNLRQVHLVHAELLTELVARDFPVFPGSIGGNITTSGVELLKLAKGTELHIGTQAVLAITGLRNPCSQLDRFSEGLMAAALERAPNGELIRKAGVMAIVRVGGLVSPGDTIRVVTQLGEARPLKPV